MGSPGECPRGRQSQEEAEGERNLAGVFVVEALKIEQEGGRELESFESGKEAVVGKTGKS